MKVIKGLFLIMVGVCVLIGGFSVGVAWLGICFGTVITGILLLIFAPTIIILPFTFSFSLGGGLIGAGVLYMMESS